jgi:hypothetical protein
MVRLASLIHSGDGPLGGSYLIHTRGAGARGLVFLQQQTENGPIRRIRGASFNGRELGDDALDVMLTLATNSPLVDGIAPIAGAVARISLITERRIRRRSRSG